MIQQANLIQERFDAETGKLQEKQQDYQQRQVSMNKEDEEAYRLWCSNAMFRSVIFSNSSSTTLDPMATRSSSY